MSYILGALRKAEQERRQDQALEGADWDNAAWNSHDSKNTANPALKVVLSVVILLLLVIFVLLWRLFSQETQVEVVPGSAVNTAVETGNESSEAYGGDLDPQSVGELESSAEGVSGGVPADKPAFGSAGQGPNIPEITGHLYFPQNGELSRIFSGEGSYRVGHEFEDGLTLVSVSQNLAVFDWRGETFEVILR